MKEGKVTKATCGGGSLHHMPEPKPSRGHLSANLDLRPVSKTLAGFFQTSLPMQIYGTPFTSQLPSPALGQFFCKLLSLTRRPLKCLSPGAFAVKPKGGLCSAVFTSRSTRPGPRQKLHILFQSGPLVPAALHSPGQPFQRLACKEPAHNPGPKCVGEHTDPLSVPRSARGRREEVG